MHEALYPYLTGCLMYIMICIWLDLCTTLHILNRYTNNNNKELWKNLKQMQLHLKDSNNIKLNYLRGEYDNSLSGYVDSDCGSNDEKQKKYNGIFA
jgi:hypothetical protein